MDLEQMTQTRAAGGASPMDREPVGSELRPSAPRLRGRAIHDAHLGLLAARGPGLRPRDAAEALGVSEAELVASRCGERVVRLVDDPRALIAALPELGPVKAITRNDHCVHEKVGRYDHISFTGAMGLVVNHDIDLRLFLGHWRSAFLVPSVGPDGRTRHSIQFFDQDGTAVHKVFGAPDAGASAFEAIATRFAHACQAPDHSVSPLPPAAPDRPDAAVEVGELEAGWRALEDTHDFFGLLRSHAVGRLQAFRLVGDNLAMRAPRTAVDRVLAQAAAQGVPVMVFVGNPGCIQIHTGVVERVETRGPWLNVLDPAFDLHLRRDRIASAWLVRKPTVDGIVTSLELFAADGSCFCQLFGARKPGRAEDPAWRTLVEAACVEGVA